MGAEELLLAHFPNDSGQSRSGRRPPPAIFMWEEEGFVHKNKIEIKVT